MINVSKEVKFTTARSGGKGGQNVNKVETMAIGNFYVDGSLLLSNEEKILIKQKLTHKITDEGFLQVRSQTERSQLGNKEEVVKKMNLLVNKALIQPKKRKATRPSRAAGEKRIESKKKKGEVKLNRKKVNY